MTNLRASRHQRTSTNGLSVGARALLCVAIAGALFGAHTSAHAAAAAASGADASAAIDANFDRSLLSGAGNNTNDLSRFERGNVVMPGVYRTDIFLNNVWVGRGDVRFASATPDAPAAPCLTKAMYEQFGLPLQKLSAELQAKLTNDANSCVVIGDLIPSATMSFDQPNLRLDVSIPQAWLGTRARGYVSPENWDRGVNAALLNYNFNSYRNHSNGVTQTSSFLGLNTGINLAGWQLRNDSTVVMQSGGPAGTRSTTHWQNIDTYLRRDIPSLRSQLTIGDSYTSGDLFDAMSIRGVQLATDDRMLPDSLRGYAPTVRGVAETNAKVTVRQNGVVLYETTVAPGPFTISDLYATGYGGDLSVTVTEADGRIRSFAVPYASVPQLLRPGVMRFSIAAGELHDLSIHAHPALVEATLQRGINNMLTGYAGVVGTNGYGAVEIGSALNTKYGALALDLTDSRTQIPGQSTQNGQSVRLSYSKILPDTNTSLTVATYRYSTSGYLGLRDAMTLRDIANGYRYVDPTTQTAIDGINTTNLLTPAQIRALQGNQGNFSTYTSQLDRQRSRFDISLNQRLGDHGGTVFVTGSAIDYWNRNGTDVQFQAGYNNTFHRLSYTISASRTRDAFSRTSNQVFASFTLPLGNSVHAPNIGASMTHDSTGHTLDQATINGTLGVDNQFSYGATASHDNGAGQGNSGGNAGTVYAGYRSPFAQLNGSIGAGNGYSQASLGVSGAVVVHPGGVTFGLPMGDTVAVVEAKDAAGARVLNASGVRIDRFGYALIPYMTPYGLNTVQIDPKGLPLTVQLDATSAQVAPHAGAVVMVKFKTEYGRTVLLRIRQSDGKAIPFGAEIVDEKNQSVGVIGQGGRALVRGAQNEGRFNVQWKLEDSSAMSCGFSYQLKPVDKKNATMAGLETVDATCTPVASIGNAP